MSSGENISNTTEPCSEFDSYPYVIVALLSASTALVSVLACLAVIVLMMVFKKYQFFIQRLILYLCIAALLNSTAIALRLQRIAYNRDTPDLHRLCIATAFFDQATAWAEHFAICCITVNLLVNAVFHKETEKVEPVYIVLIFIVPVLLGLVPLIDESYGESGAWCWIRGTNELTCDKHITGVYFQYILWYVPAYVILAIILLVYIFIIYKVYRQRHHWEGKYDPNVETQKKMIQKEVWPLMFYPLGYLVLNLFPLINRLVDNISPNNPVYALWILHAIFSPLQGGYIALVYTLDRETLRRVNCTNFKACLFRQRTTIGEYPVKRGPSDSFSESDRISSENKTSYMSYTGMGGSSGSIRQPA